MTSNYGVLLEEALYLLQVTPLIAVHRVRKVSQVRNSFQGKQNCERRKRRAHNDVGKTMTKNKRHYNNNEESIV